MINKTQGVVLRYFKYKETSIIVDIFTCDYGLVSYIVNRVRTRKPAFPISLFQPLNLLELVTYHKSRDGLQRFTEAKNNPLFKSINTDLRKSTIALFLSEVLFKTLRHESHPQEIFDFLHSSLVHFDLQKEAVTEFHLKFMLRLSRFLGFSPGDSATLMHQLLRDEPKLEKQIDLLIHRDYNELVITSYQERINILNHLIDFYSVHIDNFGELKSYPVLHTILTD